MNMRAGELVDKYTIAQLYVEREGNGDGEVKRLQVGVDELRGKHPELPWDTLIDMAKSVNNVIWDYEAPIHTGKMDGDPVVAGILSLRVRKFNVIRVKISNMIDELVGTI